MIITSVFGGLGNQLFQYAAGRALSLKSNTSLKFHTLNFRGYHRQYLLPSLGISFPEATETELSLCRVFSEVEPFKYDPRFETLGNNIFLQGHWQNYRYVFMGQVISDFVTAGRGTYVSVHVRRGDYVGNNDVGGICDDLYYKRAMSFMRERNGRVTFRVFSDDIGGLKEWAKEDVQLVEEKDPVRAFLSMSSCDHHIIANSTFSWWAAYLNPNKDKMVIAPKVWHRRYACEGIYPKEWVLL